MQATEEDNPFRCESSGNSTHVGRFTPPPSPSEVHKVDTENNNDDGSSASKPSTTSSAASRDSDQPHRGWSSPPNQNLVGAYQCPGPEADTDNNSTSRSLSGSVDPGPNEQTLSGGSSQTDKQASGTEEQTLLLKDAGHQVPKEEQGRRGCTSQQSPPVKLVLPSTKQNSKVNSKTRRRRDKTQGSAKAVYAAVPDKEQPQEITQEENSDKELSALIPSMTSWAQIKAYCKDRKYALYVLTMLMLSYLVNQLAVFCLIATNLSMSQELEYGDRECQPENETAIDIWLDENDINATAHDYCLKVEEGSVDCNDHLLNGTEDQVCYWKYLGYGLEYQLLAGPLYVTLYAISGIPMGMAAEIGNLNRKWFLVVCIFLWSLVTMLGGLATEYWHAAVCRLLLGIFGAACVPFSASLITDYFPQNERAAAMGFFTWGIFVGYSLTYVLLIAEEYMGWRAVYFLAGIPGMVLAVIMAPTVKEPERTTVETKTWSVMCEQLKMACKYFFGAVLLIVSLGGAVRNGAGIVWAYNMVIFFEEYHPDVNVAYWMSWVPLIFGSTSALGGGAYADRLLKNWGMRGRLGIVIIFTLIATPFQCGVILLPMPWAMISHMIGYLFAEMWLGVLLAVVVEQVPLNLSASATAIFFFIIQIIGGNMNLFVTPITDSLNMQAAMLICFPGFYVLACAIFALALPFVWNEKKHNYDLDTDTEVIEVVDGKIVHRTHDNKSELSVENPSFTADDTCKEKNPIPTDTDDTQDEKTDATYEKKEC